MTTITLQEAEAALKALREADTTGWTSEQHRRHADAWSRAGHLLFILRKKPAFVFPDAKTEKAAQADLFDAT